LRVVLGVEGNATSVDCTPLSGASWMMIDGLAFLRWTVFPCRWLTDSDVGESGVGVDVSSSGPGSITISKEASESLMLARRLRAN
jgi:hypothetical protein